MPTRGRGRKPLTEQSASRAFGRVANAFRGQYVVKLPADRVKTLVSSGSGDHFDAGKGKPMKEWLAISGREDVWMRLAKEAYQFVGGPLSGGAS